MRRWTGFSPGTEEAILPLSSVMAIMSTPRHRAKYGGDYVSSVPSYAQAFFERLREVTKDAEFWRPRPAAAPP